MSTPPREPDFELLSAYLDGELDAEDRARVEAYLAAHPEARAELDELRALDRAAAAPAPGERELDLDAFTREMWAQVDRERERVRGGGSFFGWKNLWVPLAAAAVALVVVMRMPQRKPEFATATRPQAVLAPQSSEVASQAPASDVSTPQAAPSVPKPQAKRKDAAAPAPNPAPAAGTIMHQAFDTPPPGAAEPDARSKEARLSKTRQGAPKADAPPTMTSDKLEASGGMAPAPASPVAGERAEGGAASGMASKAQPLADRALLKSTDRDAAEAPFRLQLNKLHLGEPLQAVDLSAHLSARWAETAGDWKSFTAAHPGVALGWAGLGRAEREEYMRHKHADDARAAATALREAARLDTALASNAVLRALLQQVAPATSSTPAGR